jgi:4-amino-4-deoxy-L-arabinose transferase-like glycosyltransferase
MIYISKNIIKNVGVVIFFLIIFFVIIFFSLRGLTYFDEGYILNAALRTVHGQIPYKDFDMVYTPLSFVYTAGFLKLFGENVLSERLAAMAISFFSVAGLICVIRLFTRNIWIIALSVVFFIAWGATHTNFVWPVMLAICFLLYTSLFYFLGIKRKSKKLFFLAGILTVLIFLTKQNFGAGVFFVLLLSFVFVSNPKKKQLFFAYLLGVISLSIAFILYLLATSSLLPFMENMYIYTVKRVIFDKQLDTPFLYDGSILARIGKLFFYTFPLIISFICSWILIKKDKKMLFIPLLVAIFYIFGVRPTTDYVHVSPLIALSILPIIMIISYTDSSSLKSIMVGILIFLTGLGLYTAYYKGYYQWETPMKYYTHYTSNSRIRIFLAKDQSADADALQQYIDSRTKKNEYIFVNAYEPFVYFLTDRNNATPYDLVSPNQLPLSYQKNIIKLLQEKKVKVTMIHELNKSEKSMVSSYIEKNYHYTKTIAHFLIFEK